MKRMAALLLLGFACIPAMADESASWQDQNGTVYLTGGIGDEELARIVEARKDFNVRLLMAEKTGAYIADVRVKISDGKGKPVLDVAGAGPFLLVKLARGSYRVDADYAGRTLTRKFDVSGGSGPEVSLLW